MGKVLMEITMSLDGYVAGPDVSPNEPMGRGGEDLIVRLAADAAESVQGEPGVRPFDLTGRPMKGWLLVAADGHAEDDDLRRWVDRGATYAASLPPKGP